MQLTLQKLDKGFDSSVACLLQHERIAMYHYDRYNDMSDKQFKAMCKRTRGGQSGVGEAMIIPFVSMSLIVICAAIAAFFA